MGRSVGNMAYFLKWWGEGEGKCKGDKFRNRWVLNVLQTLS